VNKDSGVLDNRRDLINIQITQDGSTKQVLAEGFGSYLEQVTFDEKKGSLWTINDN